MLIAAVVLDVFVLAVLGYVLFSRRFVDRLAVRIVVELNADNIARDIADELYEGVYTGRMQ